MVGLLSFLLAFAKTTAPFSSGQGRVVISPPCSSVPINFFSWKDLLHGLRMGFIYVLTS